MPFLAPTDKEKLDAMNKPYDIKKSCWVKDDKDAFIAGEIQSDDGDKVTVKTVKNTVRNLISSINSIIMMIIIIYIIIIYSKHQKLIYYS